MRHHRGKLESVTWQNGPYGEMLAGESLEGHGANQSGQAQAMVVQIGLLRSGTWVTGILFIFKKHRFNSCGVV